MKYTKDNEKDSKNKPVYRVTVYNANGSNTYDTYNSNVLNNFSHGNEETVMFVTIHGKIVSLPPTQVIIEQEKLKN